MDEKFWRADGGDGKRVSLLRRPYAVITLWIYRFLFLPALLIVAPAYLLRMRKRGGYSRHFGDRFGGFDRVPEKRAGIKRLWIQAVSVGELLAIGPLLQKLKAEADLDVVLTTTTSTGYTLAQERYRELVVAIGYFPIDAWFFSRRTWKKLSPDLAVLMESEWWPEHFAQAKVNGVPLVCLNARLSDRSFGRMRRVRGIIRALFGHVAQILVGSEQDSERFLSLGFSPSQVKTIGNFKLDLVVSEPTIIEQDAIRSSLGFPAEELIVLGSSTWPGEEAALISGFRALRAKGVASRLLLVPRHAERRGEIIAMLADSGFSYHVRSLGRVAGTVDITLADTTGELRKLTSIADIVFVGKSLPPHREGQTPIEAAALGKPILFGPEMSNFRPISLDLVSVGAARVVSNVDALELQLMALSRSAEQRLAMAAAATTWHRVNQGALARTFAALQEILRSL